MTTMTYRKPKPAVRHVNRWLLPYVGLAIVAIWVGCWVLYKAGWL